MKALKIVNETLEVINSKGVTNLEWVEKQLREVSNLLEDKENLLRGVIDDSLVYIDKEEFDSLRLVSSKEVKYDKENDTFVIDINDDPWDY